MPYLFLSYARADADGHLERFFKDLCEEVRARTGLRFDDIGFRDVQNVPLGTDWRVRLSEAIASARVFVALSSPSYFNSDMCGREWQMFAELTRARQPGVTDPPGNLLPITWFPTKQLPDAARWLQHSHADLGEVYMKEGLNYLARLKRYRDDYDEFVVRLAQQIEAAAGEHPPPPPPSPPDLSSTPSAFLIGPSTGETERERVERHAFHPGLPTAPADPAPHGPHHVTFVIVAAPMQEIAEIREDTHFYDTNPFRWSPYRPRSSRRICVSAQRVAAAKEMTSELARAFADTSIAELHAKAKARNQILALIVDVWTAQLAPYRQVLLAYDGNYEGNAKWTSPVLVPWSEADAELVALFAVRRADLGRAFPAISSRGEALFRDDIPTHEHFKTTLDEVLTLAQSRILVSGDVRRRAGGDRQIERPFLSPPDDPSDDPPDEST